MSVWMHGLLAARVAVGLERRRGRSCRRYYLYPFGVSASGREVAPPGLLSGRPALSPSVAGSAAITNSVICLLCDTPTCRSGVPSVARLHRCTVAGIAATRTRLRAARRAHLLVTSTRTRGAGVPSVARLHRRTVAGIAATRTKSRAARRAHLLLVTSTRTRRTGVPSVAQLHRRTVAGIAATRTKSRAARRAHLLVTSTRTRRTGVRRSLQWLGCNLDSR